MPDKTRADLGEIGADVLFDDRDEHAQLLEQEVAQPLLEERMNLH